MYKLSFLVVYHGSGEKFEKFDKTKIGKNYTYSENSGFFFTQREQSAKNYAHLHTGGKSDGYVYDVYLRINNPIVRSTNSDYYAPADFFDLHGHELMREVWQDKSIDGIIIKGTSGLLLSSTTFESPNHCWKLSNASNSFMCLMTYCP